MTASDDIPVFTISQLNRRVRQLLEIHLPLIWVEGEISNLSRPGSGHWYFTLKDEDAQVRCAMFRNRNSTVRFQPKHGDHVLVRCRVSLYEGRGDYQLIVEHMEPAGYGALQKRFDELRARLAAEGLFDEKYKQPLPLQPHHLGVVTSPTGAALQDILAVLRKRFPALPVTVYPVSVQGNKAAAEIAAAIAAANRHQQCDVLIVGRGGGSLEDLWPFNEEVVAHAIHASTIPVVSAVGHETDFTIADFVADVRAPTPSAAAELITPDAEQLLRRLRQAHLALQHAMQRVLQRKSQQLDWLSQRIVSPTRRLELWQQRLEHLQQRLNAVMVREFTSRHYQLERLDARLQQRHPRTLHARHSETVAQLNQRLHHAIERRLADGRQRLAHQAGMLNAFSPLQTLERGYAIAQSEQGTVVRSVTQTAVGSRIDIRLSDGGLQCRVEEIRARDDEQR